MKSFRGSFIVFIITSIIALNISLFSTPQAKGSSTQTKGFQTTTKIRPRPDLKVEKIWLDKRCQIHFSLKNSGKVMIPAKLHRMVMVNLWIGNKKTMFRFKGRSFVTSVDPKGFLRFPGRVVQFNTRKKLTKVARVMVFVDSYKKITEASEINNRKILPLSPKCVTMAAPASKTVKGTVPKPPRSTPRSQVRYPSPTAEINTFSMRKGSTPTTGMMSMGTSTFRSTYTVEYLDKIRFRYHATGCNVSEVSTKLESFLPGESSPYTWWNTNDDSRIENKCFSTVGGTNAREVRKTMDYVLTVTARGTNPMFRKKVTKKIRVNVRRPELVLERPVVIDSGGQFKVELWVKNKGRIKYPGGGARIDGRLWVLNHHNPSHKYHDERFDTSGVSLNAGERKKVATFTVEPRHHLTAARKIIIKAEAYDGRNLFTERGKNTEITHTFREQTLEMNTDLLFGLLSGMMSGNIRLNNYRSHSGNTTRTRPGTSNDCRVVLGSEDTVFTIPFWSIKVTGKLTGHTYLDFRPFFNDINADVGNARDFSVPRRNAVRLIINFETEGTEIKGYDYDDGVYNDSKMPDLNIQELKLDITFYLNVVNGKLKVSNFSLSPTVRLRAEGRYENILNMFKSKLTDYINSNLSNMIKNMLGLDSFISRLNNEIGTALGIMGVYTIRKVELTSSKLKITYL